MNNPGIDLEIWKHLRKKWSDLDASGHQVSVQFKLITDPHVTNKVLAIDVIQKIDDETFTETVQHIAGEAYMTLGIADTSTEHLAEIYKQTLRQIHSQNGQKDAVLIVSMSPTSPTSGEVQAVLKKKDPASKKNLEVNYIHYYILNALREKMVEIKGAAWNKVNAVYQQDDLKLYFEY